MLAKNFKYRGLMELFEVVSSIPRPTFFEGRIADYICNFAEERGLFFVRDEYNNVFVRLSASEGREGDEAILLQGHTDMVCEKNAGVEHDFYNDGIELYEGDDGFIRARGTTLGADNGVAVAIMLYILDGAEGVISSHPTIECLFTSSEEVGLVGAGNFDYSVVTATKMINMDSADESEIIVGCAGGQRSDLIFNEKGEACDMPMLKISINGLFGGHSGEDINKGRANANKLMGRALMRIYKQHALRLVSLNGGSKDNAIPRECEAVIAVQSKDGIFEILKELENEIRSELVSDDCEFCLQVEGIGGSGLALSYDATRKIIFLLASAADGAFKMCEGLDSVVEYSRNLGIARVDAQAGEGLFAFMARSSKDSQIKASSDEIDAYAEMLGMEHKIVSSYSGWDGSAESPLCKSYSECYRSLYGKECRVNVIHAGLECGVIKKLCPQLDIISCGAIVLDLHSPDEALNIESFERFFTVISSILTKIK